jgi:hypothetical protein
MLTIFFVKRDSLESRSKPLPSFMSCSGLMTIAWYLRSSIASWSSVCQ